MTASTDSEQSKPKTIPANTSTSATTVCRICFSGEEDGKLNKYCLCMGSIEHSHHSCLVRWIQESGCHKCELCGFNYHLVVRSSCCWRWRCPPIQPNEHFFLAIYTVAWLTLAGSIAWLAYITYGDDPLYRESELATIIYGVYGMIAVASTSIIIVETSCVVWPHLLTMYRMNQETVIVPIASNYKLRRTTSKPLIPLPRPQFNRVRSPASFTNIHEQPLTPRITLPRSSRPSDGRPNFALSPQPPVPPPGPPSPQALWVHDYTVVYPYPGRNPGSIMAKEPKALMPSPSSLEELMKMKEFRFPFPIPAPVVPSAGPYTMTAAATSSNAWSLDPWASCSEVYQEVKSLEDSDSTDSFFTSVSTQSYPQETSEGLSVPTTARTESEIQSSREQQFEVKVHKLGTRKMMTNRHCVSDSMLLAYRSSDDTLYETKTGH